MSSCLTIGIAIGASRVKVLSAVDNVLEHSVNVRDHLGDPRGILRELLEPIDPGTVSRLVITGREGTALGNGSRVYESRAIEEGLRLLDLRADVVVSLGGESFAVYPLAPDGSVLDYVAGNRCAAGTVEFFKQQLGRMDLTIDQSVEAARGGSIVPLARRCSVHCKSDCTHLLNKKLCTVRDIVRTLCNNMAEKVAGLVRNAQLEGGRMVVIGGASVNAVIIEDIRRLLPEFEIVVPREAPYFEAFGAAGLAERHSQPVPAKWDDLFTERESSFGFLPPLRNYESMVTVLHGGRGPIHADRIYLLGVDGGSTTTKVALVDSESLEICASCYLRTGGNPEKALKACLEDLQRQIKAAVGHDLPRIEGIATTGSSGEVLSVICETPWYHNEIIAHAYGAAHFCPDADTIFEIGGQDSKFTSLRHRVAIDFNMNESCSAGTGSFIEETARDDLGVPMESIAELALRADRPPRFSDQCAAFANTDTRKAFQEGATREDNLAGLVYAIVENYINKVVGRRRIGDRILFQGGTSRNLAIACAFAARTGKPLTVPPDSELMGCYGIALWLREKLRSGEAHEAPCDLQGILSSRVVDAGTFTCKACENLCEIRNLQINGTNYPFGGQCSRWENTRRHVKTRTEDLDLVKRRGELLFREHGVAPSQDTNGNKPVIGMPAAFSIHALYPLYSRFFHELGYDVVLAEETDPAGMQKCQAARCYPYEIAHGTYASLLARGVRKVFAPHLVAMPPEDPGHTSKSCPIAQGMPYYLQAAFPDPSVELLHPVLDMSAGFGAAEPVFAQLAEQLGHTAQQGSAAFRSGCRSQEAFRAAARQEGAQALEQLRSEEGIGIVLVGRPYSAFARIANMGVPRKFASAGVRILPCDFLPYEDQPCPQSMYWTYGRLILKSLEYVSKSPNLFAVYISNFGCGPDSFIQHTAAQIMGRKPYLYLELDSHTADAGIATRVAAFLDIVSGYRRAGEQKAVQTSFKRAVMETRGRRLFVRSSSGERVALTDRRVSLAFPSMGRRHTQAVSAAAARVGLRCVSMPPADERVLALGKAYTSGKECVPAVLTVGSLLDYHRNRFRKQRPDEILVYFMPTANGPCRFGQYSVYMQMLIDNMGMEDVVLCSPTADDGYRGMGRSFLMSSWQGVVLSNLWADLEAVLEVAAEDRDSAADTLETCWQDVLASLSRGYGPTWRAVRRAADELARIPLKRDPRTVPKVLLTGEIFVRNDELSRRGIVRDYADEGIMLKTSDTTEWVYYTDWICMRRLAARMGNGDDFLSGRYLLGRIARALFRADALSRSFITSRVKLAFEQSVERRARRILGRSGLLVTEAHPIEKVTAHGAGFVHPDLTGEAILSTGAARKVMQDSNSENYCGVVCIGPFNCMPTGLAEALIKPYARREGIPYLTFETDGGPMPPNFRSQMEVHMLRASRFAAAGPGGRTATATLSD